MRPKKTRCEGFAEKSASPLAKASLRSAGPIFRHTPARDRIRTGDYIRLRHRRSSQTEQQGHEVTAKLRMAAGHAEPRAAFFRGSSLHSTYRAMLRWCLCRWRNHFSYVQPIHHAPSLKIVAMLMLWLARWLVPVSAHGSSVPVSGIARQHPRILNRAQIAKLSCS